jgi:hypothetical protein
VSQPKQVAKLVQEIAENQVRAARDLEDVPANSRPGIEMSIRQAKDQVTVLEAEYAAYVKDRAFTIFPVGPHAEEYAGIAAVEGETVNVSARMLYNVVSEDIEVSLGARRLFGVTQLTMLLNGLSDIGRELDLINLPIPQIVDVPHLPDFEALVDFVRSITREAIGDRVQVPFIEREVTRTALERGYSLSRIPVVITGTVPAEQESLSQLLFSGKGFVVDTRGGVTKETVHSSFKSINAQLKKS